MSTKTPPELQRGITYGIVARPGWQYFSKFHRRWIDGKTSDRKAELIKYGYKIRDTPEVKS